MRIVALAILLASAAMSCNGQGEEFELRPTPNPLVDNLFVEQLTGYVSTMNLANGTFRLVGRCLTVNTGEGERTPLFMLRGAIATPSAGGISLGEGQSLQYGVLYALPGAVPGPRLETGTGGRCPRETLVIRGIERLENIPEPKMPPLTPERR